MYIYPPLFDVVHRMRLQSGSPPNVYLTETLETSTPAYLVKSSICCFLPTSFLIHSLPIGLLILFFLCSIFYYCLPTLSLVNTNYPTIFFYSSIPPNLSTQPPPFYTWHMERTSTYVSLHNPPLYLHPNLLCFDSPYNYLYLLMLRLASYLLPPRCFYFLLQ